jgi:outer membrane protein TolC
MIMLMRLLRPLLPALLLMRALPLQAAEAAPPSPSPGAPAPSTPEAAAPGVPLSLAEAIRLAQERSPLARAAQAGVAAAAARLRGARAPESPELALAHNFGSDQVATDEGILIVQALPIGTKRRAPIRSAQAQRGAAAAAAEQTRLEITRSAQEAYYQALAADAGRQLAADALHTSQAFAQAAQTQYEAGEVAQNQVVRSQIDVAKAQQDLAAAEQEQADRYSELRSLFGLPAGAVLHLTDTLAATPRAYALPELLAEAMQARPDLRAARLEEAAREADVQAARAQSHPDLFWEVRYDPFGVDAAPGATGLRTGVVLPLLDLGRQRAGVQEAEAALAGQRAVREDAERTARLEVETALHALDLAREQLASFETGRLARAKELLDMTQIGYQQGASSYLEVVDAEQAYRTEQEAYVQAQAQYHLARAALEQAVGGKLP